MPRTYSKRNSPAVVAMMVPSGLRSAAMGTSPKSALRVEGVGVVVEVDVLVGVEVDGVGAGGVGAVVEVGVEDLGGEGLPAAGAAAEGGASPALADAAELLLDRGDQLLVDGRPVGADVGGVYVVAVVVVGVGVLDVEHDDARQTAGGPVLEELVAVIGCVCEPLLPRLGFGREEGQRAPKPAWK